jgi:phosphatidylglycerophosphatase A
MSPRLVRVLRRAIVSVGGIGFLPRAPATAGTLAGAAVFLGLRPTLRQQVALVGAAAILGHICSAPLTPDARDPQYIVIDEVAGVWLALMALPPTAMTCGAGAVVFRILDKLKPGPIGLIDRRGGRWSVMGDDLVAGLCGNLILRAGRAAVGAPR